MGETFVANSVTEGGCLCGAIRYATQGAPTASMICHCNTCCRAAGAPVVAWLTFPKSHFSIVRGVPAEFHSTVPVTRTFCSSCRTSLTYVHGERPSDIDVVTSSLDNPEAFPRPITRGCATASAGFDSGMAYPPINAAVPRARVLTSNPALEPSRATVTTTPAEE